MLYFAYGSNLLPARLAARCPSAQFTGAALVNDYALAFSKPSLDGSGKATIIRSPNGHVHGGLYEIADYDLPALDRAEIGYNRIDDLVVGSGTACVTYFAQAPQPDLAPYDWYLALVVAGARACALDPDYIEDLRERPFIDDPRPACQHRDAAHAALTASGYATIFDALEHRKS